MVLVRRGERVSGRPSADGLGAGRREPMGLHAPVCLPGGRARRAARLVDRRRRRDLARLGLPRVPGAVPDHADARRPHHRDVGGRLPRRGAARRAVPGRLRRGALPPLALPRPLGRAAAPLRVAVPARAADGVHPTGGARVRALPRPAWHPSLGDPPTRAAARAAHRAHRRHRAPGGASSGSPGRSQPGS